MRALRAVTSGSVAAAVALTTGCSEQSEPAAREVASAFAGAVSGERGARACSLLVPATRRQLEQSSGQRCRAAILDEGVRAAGPVEDLASFGTMARARFSDDVVFLAEFKGGWRVLAAGCSPVPDRPYECLLHGG